MAKVKVVFFLPVKDNDGRPLQAEIDDVEMDLIVSFVGWTFQGYVKGYYQMSDGTRCLDVNAAYFIVADESRVDEVAEILRSFLEKTKQEAISMEIQDNIKFRFITRGVRDDPSAN